MSEKAKIINFRPSNVECDKKKSVELDSGCQILVCSRENEDVIAIAEPQGEVVVKVRMTDGGPVISVRGAHLELKSTETIALKAKKIKIQAEEEAVVQSKGRLELDASNKMGIRSVDDIHVAGKMIYLN